MSMELEQIPLAGNLIDQIDEQRDQLIQQTESLSGTREEYLALPLQERMEMARNITSKYACSREHHSKAPGEGWPASVVMTTDRADLVLDARVAYRPEEGRPTYGDDYEILKYPDVSVWIRARDTKDDLASGFSMVGRVVFGPYKVEDGTKYGKWLRETHAEVFRKQPQQLSRSVQTEWPLEAPEASGIIEIIDEAATSIIEGVVARHRRLGGIAIWQELQE
jgi:hypothetical protein